MYMNGLEQGATILSKKKRDSFGFTSKCPVSCSLCLFEEEADVSGGTAAVLPHRIDVDFLNSSTPRVAIAPERACPIERASPDLTKPACLASAAKVRGGIMADEGRHRGFMRWISRL